MKMKWILILIPILIIGLVFAFNAVKKSDNLDNLDNQMTGASHDYTDPNAPKTIESKEIVSFEYTFPTPDLNQWQDRDIPYARCDFNLIREDNEARYTGEGYGDLGAIFGFDFQVPLSALDDLQEIIDKHELAKVNGIDKEILGISAEYLTRLQVKYASGERIYATDNAHHILPYEATVELYDFFLALAKSVDSEAMYTDEEFSALDSSR